MKTIGKFKLPYSPAVKKSKILDAMLSDSPYFDRYADCLYNVQHWSLTRLQEFYRHEYNSLRSRKQQAKNRHIKFDERLRDLRDWLIHIGPRPAEGWTVDRINNYRGYEPGNIRWATKAQQTENRKVTKWHVVNGKYMTTAQLAKHLGLTYTCLYKRLQHGWTVDRLLDEQEKHGGIKSWKFPGEAMHVLEPLYAKRKSHNQSRIDWYIAYLKRNLRDIEHANILQQISDVDHALLLLQLEKVEAELAALLKQQREQAESEVQALIVAFKGPVQFLHFPTPPEAPAD